MACPDTNFEHLNYLTMQAITNDLLEPVKPKRASSAFILFSNQSYKETQRSMARDGTAPPQSQDIAKQASKAWKSLPKAARSPWEHQARQDRLRYQQEMEIYKQDMRLYRTALRHAGKPLPAKRHKRDKNAPQKPRPIFLLFSNSKRHAIKRQNPQMTNGEISQELSAQWKQVSPEERKRYQQEVLDDRVRYQRELAEYNRRQESAELRKCCDQLEAKPATKVVASQSAAPVQDDDTAETITDSGIFSSSDEPVDRLFRQLDADLDSFPLDIFHLDVSEDDALTEEELHNLLHSV